MEFLNYYASLGRIFRQRAVEVARNLQQYPNEVVPLSDEQFEAALTMYAQRQDKTWGLIVHHFSLCNSGVSRKHLPMMSIKQAGFIPLLRES